MNREALYVGLTRGRLANHAYIATDTAGPEGHVVTDAPTGRQVLEAVLRSPAAETSATSALRRRQDEHILTLTRAGQWPPPPDTRPVDSPYAGPPNRPPPAAGITR